MKKFTILIILIFAFTFVQIGDVQKGNQDLVVTGYKFDNVTKNEDTWYLHTNALGTYRETLWIMNNGVNNNLSTGVLYVSLQSTITTGTATVETDAITIAGILVLNAGDSIFLKVRPSVHVSIQGDTANLCAAIIEMDTVNLEKTDLDSR